MAEVKKPDVVKKDESVNIVDLFFYLLSYWPLFLLSVLLCTGYAVYRYYKSPLVFRSDATVVIKDPMFTKSSVNLDQYRKLINKVDISTEILLFRSQSLMKEVVSRLDANVSYQQKQGIRFLEMYKDSPLLVDFIDADDATAASFVVTVLNESQARLTLPGQMARTVELNDTVSANCGRICVMPGRSFGMEWLGKDIYVNRSPVIASALGFISRLKVNQNGETTILNLSLQDNSRMRAVDVMDELVVVYNEDAIKDKNRLAINTDSFINERLISIEDELNGVEDRLATYKSQRQIMSANESASLFLSESRGAIAKIEDYDTQLRLVEFIRDFIQDPANRESLIPLNIGVADSRIEGLAAQYNAMKMRYDNLRRESSAENPYVVELSNNLEMMRRTILASIDNTISSIAIKKSDARSQELEARANFADMPSWAKEMVGIERQQKIKESLYTFLLNKREENALVQAMADNNARLIDPPSITYAPISPNRNKMLALAILAGLLIPAAILLARLFLDNRVRGRKDLEDGLTAPYLGEVPLIKEKAVKAANQIVYNPKSKGYLTEAFRMLCTNVDFMLTENIGNPVVAVNSYSENSGKTFITLNMAYCLSDAGKKVVMVDLDLRKRSLSGLFKLKHGHRGASNFLYDNRLTLGEIISHDVIKGVDMIPAGSLPPNPVELLRRPRLEELIAGLRKQYDYIVLDSVPVDLLADAQIVSRVADVNVFVVRSNKFDRRLLPKIEEMYQKGVIRNMGIVLNGSESYGGYGRYGYRYGYYAYSGYGYGYGYGYGALYGKKYGYDQEDQKG